MKPGPEQKMEIKLLKVWIGSLKAYRPRVEPEAGHINSLIEWLEGYVEQADADCTERGSRKMEPVLVEISVEKKHLLQKAVPSIKTAVSWETIQVLEPGATVVPLVPGLYQLPRSRYGCVASITFRIQGDGRVVSVLDDPPPEGIQRVST